MMSTTTGFLGNTDPNNTRAVEALYSLLSDVEQRLQIVKASLVSPLQGAYPQGFQQGFPQAAWPHASGSALGIGQGNTGLVPQGFHAFVPTQNGLVPVFIPAGPQGALIPGAPANFRL